VLVQEVVVLRDVPVIEVGNPEIKQDIEKKREVENYKIEAILLDANCILNGPVDTENPERLDEKVQEKKQSQVCQKFTLHECLEKSRVR